MTSHASPSGGASARMTRHESQFSDGSVVDMDAAVQSMEAGDGEASLVIPVIKDIRGSINGGMASTSLNSIPGSGPRIIHLNNPPQNASFCDNAVFTARYTKLNFVPRFMYARLSQVANFYFLLVGAGQIVPAISSTQGVPYQWIVLLIVLSIDGVFAALEDRARHRADQKMNARETQVFDLQAEASGFFRTQTWNNVKVGDILKVSNYEAVPADLLLLAVSDPDPANPVGICFIETKSLDGETNLKIRQALGCTFSQLNDPQSLGKLPGCVLTEQPNHDVNSFSARYEPYQGHTIPIDLKNIALRGSVIRNTPYVYGLVLNTGKDTKIMQSSSETPNKTSKIMAIVNRGIGILMAALLLLCVFGAVLCSIWVTENYTSAYYLQLNDLSGVAPFRNDVVGWLIYIGYYWILIASFVPITLYVTVAIVKSYQTYFLNRDLHMYDEVTDTPALVRNADLNDDLGQVTHIFSDKTGTLTANEMDFRKMSVHGVSYGRGTTEIGREAQRRLGKELSANDLLADNTPFEDDIENVHFVDPQDEYAHDSDPNLNKVQAAWIEAFLVHLAVCHSVVLEQSDAETVSTGSGASPGEGKLKFSASSPDELALVSGAKFFGYEFVGRKNGSITIKMPSHGYSGRMRQREVVYETLEVIDFSSARKRMSVVVRTPDGRIVLLTKGADSVIFPRLHPENLDSAITNMTTLHLERYANEGLRTLVIAQKEMPEDAYMAWSREYRAALSDLEQVQLQKNGEPNLIEDLEESIEMGLELLGATAIEDRLQDNVTATIADLARAGIKIWILTGDKEETAINIGFACQLLNNDMERLVINQDTYPSMSALYDLLYQRCQDRRARSKHVQDVKARTSTNSIILEEFGQAGGGVGTMASTPAVVSDAPARAQAIVIDGRSLMMVFSHPMLCDLFLDVSQYCAAVICCRVSPKQKAQVVRLYKTNIQGCRSLAIGDGANDVGMIQEAHIGIGISGHEGMQAVNSSDFAIAQFRFLKRLLLVHGHWNYRRMTKLALYVVYKNIILYCACFVLGTLSGGSGTLYYNNMWINGYNIFWTSLPIVVVGVLEQEVPAHLADRFPGLYYGGAQGEQFSLSIFAQWIAEALFEGAVTALVPALLVGHVDANGNSYSRELCGAISYCAMIIVGWAKLALNIVTWNFLTAFAFIFSFVFWFISALIISLLLPTLVADSAFPYIFSLGQFYLVIYLSILLCLGRDFLFKAFKREIYPEYYHILQEHHQCKTPAENAQWTPPELLYEFFQADLTQPKPPFELIPEPPLVLTAPPVIVDSGIHGSESGVATGSEASVVNAVADADDVVPSAHDTTTRESRSYTGFAFSTQILEDRFIHPLRELMLPMTQAVEGLGRRLPSGINRGAEGELTFEEQIKARPLEEQVVYEIQRFQIFAGWGSSFPGHLFPSDPPHFTNALMSDGTDTFDLSEFMVDNRFGSTDQWQYATKFKDYVRFPAETTNLTRHQRRRLKKKFNKLVGRCVRRRRWVRKETVIAGIAASTNGDNEITPEICDDSVVDHALDSALRDAEMVVTASLTPPDSPQHSFPTKVE